MTEFLLEPFTYTYMTKAILISALVGGTCAFMSSYLILKGWALIGDALAHSLVPGVALAYMFGLPYVIGAFLTGIFAASSMVLIKKITLLREDTIIGLVFTAFFAFGLFIVSIRPATIDLQSIILGNILAISDSEVTQLIIICLICLILLTLKWKDLTAVFFDKKHARSIALPVLPLEIMFFTLLSAATIAALQTVGACLVIAMLITPGATAYLLTDKFGKMIIIAILIGSLTSTLGAYLSYFINTNTGGLIVTLQTALFLILLCIAPKHGILARNKKIKKPAQSTQKLSYRNTISPEESKAIEHKSDKLGNPVDKSGINLLKKSNAQIYKERP
ncbi:MAG: metal ABC transporter permease [Alphaproteobacteria bacterium]